MQINLNIKKNWFNAIYYPYVFNYSHRHEIYYGGAGSGKSQFVFQKIIIKALKQKRKVLIVRKVAKTNLNSTFQMCIDILKQLQLYQYCKINLSIMQITLPNDSVIIFLGMDDPEKIKSIAGITDIVIEEATELTLDDVTQLDLRLRAKADYLQLFYMFNPTSKTNWVYKRWFSDDSIIDSDNTFILKTTYKDNRFLPKEYIESIELLKQSNPTYYKIYAEGEFCTLDKLVYNNWKAEDFDYHNINGVTAIGLDYGFSNDPSALIASIIDKDNKAIYVFDEYYEKGKTNNELAEMIKYKGFAKSVIIADAAEQKSIEEMRRAGISRIKPCTKGPDSIMYGIQKLQQYKIIVHSNCTNTITELQNYSYIKDKSTGEYINKPIDEFNHLLDALRYSIQIIDNDRKIQVLDKKLLGL